MRGMEIIIEKKSYEIDKKKLFCCYFVYMAIHLFICLMMLEYHCIVHCCVICLHAGLGGRRYVEPHPKTADSPIQETLTLIYSIAAIPL